MSSMARNAMFTIRRQESGNDAPATMRYMPQHARPPQAMISRRLTTFLHATIHARHARLFVTCPFCRSEYNIHRNSHLSERPALAAHKRRLSGK